MSPARLALAITCLGSVALLVLARLAGAGWVDVVAIIFVVLPVAAWGVALALWLAHRREPTARNLAERSIVALRDAMVATIGAGLGLNRLLTLGLPNDTATAWLSVALLLVTAYPLAWLVQWLRGRWD